MGSDQDDTRQRLERWLSERGTPAESVVETHTAVVAFTHDRVYKIKKAIRLPFLELTDQDRRRATCRREVELNRRLSPDVYLGVVDVTGDRGDVVDSAVEMIRLPDTRRLDFLLTATDPAAVAAGLSCVERTAQILADFHRSQEPLIPGDAHAARAAVRRLWRDEIEEMQVLQGTGSPSATAAARLALDYVAGRGSLFAARASDGWVREGHGDLRADSVFCLAPGPTLIDCLEFSDRLRCSDTLADAAFLAMDLERLGHPDAATDFLAAHRRLTGDDWPPSLAHHWIAYRAHVRAKVDLLQPASDRAAAERSQRHLALALDHLRAAQVRLIVVGGLPGAGKTTLATKIAEGLPAQLLSSDAVRVELFGPGRGPGGGFGQGRYSAESRGAVYDELLRRAAELLGLGHHVVIDASWATPVDRGRASELARRSRSWLTAVECRVSAAVARDRIAGRIRAGTGLSEADEAVATRMAQDWRPWPEAHVVDTTTMSPDEATAALIRRL